MRNNKISRKSRGQSLVEMALTLPLFLILIFTFIDLGRAIYYSSALGNAVREGARFASVTVNVDDTTVQDSVKAKVTGYSIAVPIPDSAVAVSISSWDDINKLWLTCSGGIDDNNGCVYVTVAATYLFDPITPLLERAFGPGNEIELSTESTMLLTPYARQ